MAKDATKDKVEGNKPGIQVTKKQGAFLFQAMRNTAETQNARMADGTVVPVPVARQFEVADQDTMLSVMKKIKSVADLDEAKGMYKFKDGELPAFTTSEKVLLKKVLDRKWDEEGAEHRAYFVPLLEA